MPELRRSASMESPMPIYEYKCKKCGAVLEMIHSSQACRKYCAGDCLHPDAPGDGDLERMISLPATSNTPLRRLGSKVDYEDAARKGFTAYKRTGKGEYEKLAGKEGPEHFSSKD